MPPRLPLTVSPWRPVADSVLSSSTSPAAPQCRAFSATTPVSGPKERVKLRLWLRKNASLFKEARGTPDRPQPMHLTSGTGNGPKGPFPLNPHFKSQPVLSEQARELIWEKVMTRGESLKAVSAELGVDVRRVAAVVRLQEVEKDWIAKKKPLARPYARAFMGMLPQTRFDEDNTAPHEPFNEVVVHPYTLQQIFEPVSESRHFTRSDAAHAFHRNLLATDKRIPHRELVKMEHQINVKGVAPVEAAKAFREATAAAEQRIADRAALKVEQEEKMTTRVVNPRGIEFRFKEYNVDDVGKNGKSLKGVGVRYGAAKYDRKKGEVKIPTSVE